MSMGVYTVPTTAQQYGMEPCLQGAQLGYSNGWGQRSLQQRGQVPGEGAGREFCSAGALGMRQDLAGGELGPCTPTSRRPQSKLGPEN